MEAHEYTVLSALIVRTEAARAFVFAVIADLAYAIVCELKPFERALFQIWETGLIPL